ncbi:ASCH domain-containing protein [Variovorax sp. ZT5P49]|uniref:ASCH domain-containing protein n=1 Tax=Variovorax sp. ZT5P49 TaxID=3443733 RepID=UPI003F470B95
MTIPSSLLPFWERFQTATGADGSARFCEAFHFDDNEAGATELAKLVLDGRKRGTASLEWSFESTDRSQPKPGDLSVVTDWHGKPLCVIETLSVVVMPFDEVGEDFAAVEAEGDGSLRYWREGHWQYFSGECERIGRKPDMRMPVLCETFEVVYQGD